MEQKPQRQHIDIDPSGGSDNGGGKLGKISGAKTYIIMAVIA